jgi:hypothetical protein
MFFTTQTTMGMVHTLNDPARTTAPRAGGYFIAEWNRRITLTCTKCGHAQCREKDHLPFKTRKIEPIRWSMSDQAWAMDHGFFFRKHPTNHSVVLEDAGRRRLGETWFDTSQNILNYIEHLAFNLDLTALKALSFIKQQDTYAYKGGWAAGCPRVRGQRPMWYANFNAAMRRHKIARRELRMIPRELNIGVSSRRRAELRALYTKAHDDCVEYKKFFDARTTPNPWIVVLGAQVPPWFHTKVDAERNPNTPLDNGH